MERCPCGYEGTEEGIMRHISMSQDHQDGEELRKIKLISDMIAVHTAVGGDRVTQIQYESLGKWSRGTVMRSFDFDSFHDFQNISLQSTPRMIEYTCSNCGKKFEKHSSERVGKEVFCSNKCTKKSESYTCYTCGDSFTRPQSYYSHRAGEKKFCSIECRSFKTEKSECDMCGDSFTYKKYNRIGRFCGQKCYNEWRKENGENIMGGENNPMWLGGRDEYYGASWRKQRRKCMERDNYKCKKCGMGNDIHISQYGQELHVHHRTKYRHFESDSEAHRLDNLVTLCVSCHNEEEER